jgi:hypothetical protein
MIAPQLVQCEPYKSFIERLIKVDGDCASDLRNRTIAVTAIPNQRRRLIQAMRQIALQIVNEGFVR